MPASWPSPRPSRTPLADGVDPARVYLAGRGAAAAGVFYTISRMPDLWAAAIAIDGSPQPAIDTDRIFAANFTNVPVLWASKGDGDQALAAKLKSAGLNIEWRAAAGLSPAASSSGSASHKRDPFPAEIDCETNSPQFASCYWIQMTKFDAAERNDVLPSTRLQARRSPRSTSAVSATRPTTPAPACWSPSCPEKYQGPLKMGDRIVALDGRPIETPQTLSRIDGAIHRAEARRRHRAARARTASGSTRSS